MAINDPTPPPPVIVPVPTPAPVDTAGLVGDFVQAVEDVLAKNHAALLSGIEDIFTEAYGKASPAQKTYVKEVGTAVAGLLVALVMGLSAGGNHWAQGIMAPVLALQAGWFALLAKIE